MHRQIQTILNDLYQIDPQLREQETELVKVIEGLLKNVPSAEMDSRFEAQLRANLMSRAQQNRNRFNLFRWLTLKKVRLAVGALVMLAFIATPLLLFIKGEPQKLATTTLAEEKIEKVALKKPEMELPTAPPSATKRVAPTEDKTFTEREGKKDRSTEKAPSPALKKEVKEEIAQEPVKTEETPGTSTIADMYMEKDKEESKDTLVPSPTATTKKKERVSLLDRIGRKAKSAPKMEADEDYAKMAESPADRKDSLQFQEEPAVLESKQLTSGQGMDITPTGNRQSVSLPLNIGTSSYESFRRTMDKGSLPQPHSVKVEEFVNYFDYEHPRSWTEIPVSYKVEISDCPWNIRRKLAFISLKTKPNADIIRQVRWEARFLPGTINSYRLVTTENTGGTYSPSTVDLTAGHSVSILMELDLPEAALSRNILSLSLSYRDPASGSTREIRSPEFGFTSWDNTSDDFRFAAGVAEYALVTSESTFKGTGSTGHAYYLSRDATGSDESGKRTEFLELTDTFLKNSIMHKSLDMDMDMETK